MEWWSGVLSPGVVAEMGRIVVIVWVWRCAAGANLLI